MTADDEHSRRFTDLRPLLFTIAYEFLGSAADADDVLQDSFLRWRDVDLARVDDDKSYLATVVTRQSLNALRSRTRRREDYIGPWLPEPILLDYADPVADVELAESVSTAMLVVLETLGPDERAVFVLLEVFGFDHDEIAAMLGKSSPAVRQTASRARAHVQARRPRFDPVDAEQGRAVVAEFLSAASTGHTERLLALLAPDAAWIADSDGKASAARRPVIGAERVGKLIVGMMRYGERLDVRIEPAAYNGSPGFAFYLGDELEGVVTVEVAAGRITNLYAMRNPDKLAGVTEPRSIAR